MTGGAPIPVREFADAAEMMRHAAEVRARMFAPRPTPVPVKAEVPLNLAEDAPTAKAWAKPKVKQISFVAPESVVPKSFKNPSLHIVRRLTDLVSFISGVSVMDIRSNRRNMEISKARQIIFYLCKTYTLHSLPEIGRRTGGRDHTTVLHGVRRVQMVIDRLNIETCDSPIVMADALWAAKWPKWAR